MRTAEARAQAPSRTMASDLDVTPRSAGKTRDVDTNNYQN